MTVKGSESVLLYGFDSSMISKIAKSTRYKIHLFSTERDPIIKCCASYYDFIKFNQDPWDESICDENEYRYLLSHLSLIYECYSRHFCNNPTTLYSIQEYESILRSHYVQIKRLFAKINPHKIIFANVPHEGFDNIMCLLSLYNEISTHACFQLHFVPRFNFVNLKADLALAFTDKLEPTKKYQLSKHEINCIHEYVRRLEGNSEYFYMTSVLERNRPVPLWKAIFKKSHVVFTAIASLSNPKRALASLYRQIRHSRYLKKLNNLRPPSTSNISPKQYIYFPLHLQPEMTTAAFGSIYCDQIIALSKAAALAKSHGLSVICKENPKQSFSHRSNFYFQSLKKFDNVYFVSKKADSRELIRNSLMVVTVIGTAGMEAIANNIPVWCLGGAWWRSIDGVAKSYAEASALLQQENEKFENKSNFQDSKSNYLDHFLSQLINMANSSWPGCCNPAGWCENYHIDKFSNSDIFARSITDIIENY